jgi:DNA polymerase-3 subunit alpha
MAQGFVHLHTHSSHSVRDSIARPDDLFDAVVADGQSALAITDHGNLSGLYVAHQSAAKRGVSLIGGIEAYMAIEDGESNARLRREIGRKSIDDSNASDTSEPGESKYTHLTLLAENEVGLKNLMRLSALSHEGDAFWSRPRMDLSLLAENSEGLIALSGCLGGAIKSRLALGDTDGANAAARDLLEIFGKDNFFIEVMSHGIAIEDSLNADLLDIAKRHDLRVVATNDSHFTSAEDSHAHDAWLCGASGKTLEDPKRWRFTGSGFHLRSAQEMRAIFDDQPGFEDACDNTLLIAERASGYSMFPKHGLRIPTFDPTNERSASELLHEKVKAGAIRRYSSPLPGVVKERLRYELDIISNAGLSDYFLIVADMIDWAKAQGIRVGPGRGSAAGSCVSFCMGIIAVDPLAHGLLFERFLNPTRNKMPDIDTDFEQGRRQEVVNYLIERWGKDSVGLIGTLGYSLSKNSLRVAGKVLGASQVGVALANQVPTLGDGKTASIKALRDPGWAPGAGFRELAAESGSEPVIEIAKRFEGVVNTESIHPCGVVIGDEELVGLIPLRSDRRTEKSGGTGGWVSEFDGEALEDLGFLKMDILGLANLDVVEAAVREIKRRHGIDLDVDTIPDTGTDEAKKAWTMVGAGRTEGIFQIEGQGTQDLARRLRPASVDELAVLIALYRPGPLGIGMHDMYANRRAGLEKISYDIFTKIPAEVEILASVMDETFGVCVTGDTRVYSVSRGLNVPITDLAIGEMVQGVDAQNRPTAGEVVASVNNGRKLVRNLKFDNGSVVRATDDHQFLTSNGWATAEQLTVGTLVASPGSLLPSLSGDYSGWDVGVTKARVLGLLLADGGLTSNTAVHFYNSEDCVTDSFVEATSEAFPGTNFGHTVRDNGVKMTWASAPKGKGGKPGTLLHWLRHIGLKPGKENRANGGPNSSEKFIPEQFLTAGEEVLISLIAAMWDCDGHVSALVNRPKTTTYKTISKQMAEDVRFVLTRLGIVSCLSISNYVSASGAKAAYQITVNDFEKFCTVIGPQLKAGAKRAASLIPDNTVRGHRGFAVEKKMLMEEIRLSGRTVKKFCRDTGIDEQRLYKKGFTSEQTARAVSSHIESSRLDAVLNCRWVKLKSNEQDGIDEVFDITVAGTHNFIANGVIVHNCVYQEQLLRIAELVAGFNPPERDNLLRAIGKKDREKMNRSGELFIKGAQANLDMAGEPKLAFAARTAENLWEAMKSAGEYSFNKSHSVGYARLSFITAWLKANYPTEYAAGWLSISDNQEKRLAFLASLREEGVELRHPDVNRSDAYPTVGDDGVVLFGLSKIRDVGTVAAEIVAERTAHGPFKSLADFASRVRVTNRTRRVSITVLRALIESGAFDAFGTRKGMFDALETLRKNPGATVSKSEWGVLEYSVRERDRLGILVSANPLSVFKDQIKTWRSPQTRSVPVALHRLPDEGNVSTIGLVTSWEVLKRKTSFAKMRLSGTKSTIDCVIWNTTLDKIVRSGTVPKVGDIIGIDGIVKTKTPYQRDADEGTDTEEVSVKELVVNSIWSFPINDETAVVDDTAPDAPTLFDKPRQERLAVAAKSVASLDDAVDAIEFEFIDPSEYDDDGFDYPAAEKPQAEAPSLLTTPAPSVASTPQRTSLARPTRSLARTTIEVHEFSGFRRIPRNPPLV